MGQITKKIPEQLLYNSSKVCTPTSRERLFYKLTEKCLYSCLLGQITLLRFMESCSTWAEVNEEKIEKEKTKVAVNWVVYAQR